ncbi:hypothetical protein KEM54_000324 [Ascosphaera aggregata]|nr:hypothetical protein KEM54_000324 [Ascosphaera aggregata]
MANLDNRCLLKASALDHSFGAVKVSKNSKAKVKMGPREEPQSETWDKLQQPVENNEDEEDSEWIAASVDQEQNQRKCQTSNRSYDREDQSDDEPWQEKRKKGSW